MARLWVRLAASSSWSWNQMQGPCMKTAKQRLLFLGFSATAPGQLQQNQGLPRVTEPEQAPWGHSNPGERQCLGVRWARHRAIYIQKATHVLPGDNAGTALGVLKEHLEQTLLATRADVKGGLRTETHHWVLLSFFRPLEYTRTE